MKIHPDPSNTSFGVSSLGAASGQLFLLFTEESQSANLDITLPPDAINAGDVVRFGFVVQGDGEGLSLYHGTDLVQELAEGLYFIDHVAVSDSRLIRFRLFDNENPASHMIGGISIEINP